MLTVLCLSRSQSNQIRSIPWHYSPSHRHPGTLPTLFANWAAVLTSAINSFLLRAFSSLFPSSSPEKNMILRAVPSPRVSSLPQSYAWSSNTRIENTQDTRSGSVKRSSFANDQPQAHFPSYGFTFNERPTDIDQCCVPLALSIRADTTGTGAELNRRSDVSHGRKNDDRLTR